MLASEKQEALVLGRARVIVLGLEKAVGSVQEAVGRALRFHRGCRSHYQYHPEAKSE
jgi:hypothetical protein